MLSLGYLPPWNAPAALPPRAQPTNIVAQSDCTQAKVLHPRYCSCSTTKGYCAEGPAHLHAVLQLLRLLLDAAHQHHVARRVEVVGDAAAGGDRGGRGQRAVSRGQGGKGVERGVEAAGLELRARVGKTGRGCEAGRKLGGRELLERFGQRG